MQLSISKVWHGLSQCFDIFLKILMWLNPAVNVKTSHDVDFEPAIAIKLETLGQFHSVLRTEVTDEIKNTTANGFSVTCPFAIDEKASIMDVRKKNNKSLVTNSKAHKIPVQLLEPSFVAYVRHLAGIREQPGCEAPKLPDLTSEKVEETMSDYDYQELVHITDTIAMKVKAFNQKPTKEQNSPTRPTQAEVLKVLSPGSETTYRTYTPKRKRAFERVSKFKEIY
ncbi:uncharacterized protein [Montipora foliosa]|uniref:uncharacterized protein isoform X1 n=1 Tax=Montipora foliosa TaxID=591990 RepID=UPI0035F13029